MQDQIQHTTSVKPHPVTRTIFGGYVTWLILITIGVGLTVSWPRQARLPSPGTVIVAPVDPGQIATLMRQHEARRSQLAVSVAPVDPGQIAALMRQHMSRSGQ